MKQFMIFSSAHNFLFIFLLELIFNQRLILAVLAEEIAYRDHKEQIEDKNVEHQAEIDYRGQVLAKLGLIDSRRSRVFWIYVLWRVHCSEINGLTIEKSGQLEDNKNCPAET